MIPLSYLQNVDGISFDIIKLTLSYIYQTPHITLLSTLFRSNQLKSSPSNLFKLDLPPTNHEKMDEKLFGEFL